MQEAPGKALLTRQAPGVPRFAVLRSLTVYSRSHHVKLATVVLGLSKALLEGTFKVNPLSLVRVNTVGLVKLRSCACTVA